jgi:subtilase family serine protease
MASFAAVLVVALPIPLPAAGRLLLQGHVPAAVARLTPLGPVPASNHLDLVLGLPLRNQEELDNLMAQIYDASSTNYHQYLSAEQFAERFSPSEEQYELLQGFARANGFTITGLHPNRTLLDVNGSVSQIEKVFQVHLQHYHHPLEPRTFYAPDREPSVELPYSLMHISGLDNYIVPHPVDLHKLPSGEPRAPIPLGGSGPSGNYLGKDFRAAYVPGSSLNGAGQTVALIHFGGYLLSDITHYESVAGIPIVPLQDVLLDGSTGQTNSATVEVELDIEMVIGIAPGLAKVINYEGAVGNDILNRIATDNLARQISCSYVIGVDSITEQIFRQYAAQGQSFFNGSGDAGAYSGSPQGPNYTNLTAVGGTALSTTGPQGAWASETAWNGSGGGIQPVFAIPSWQQGIDMSANGGSTSFRNVPDVAMHSTGAYVYEFGQDGSLAGTSASSPLFAGFCALINQQAALVGKPPVGFLNPALYELGKSPFYLTAFHDIITGNNTNSTMPTNFFAVAGYDLCTGWGTPTGTNLINALAGAPWFVWVQFGNPSPGNGSHASPYNTLARATNGVLAGGTIVMEGGSTSEKMRIGKAMTLRSAGGNASIGR